MISEDSRASEMASADFVLEHLTLERDSDSSADVWTDARVGRLHSDAPDSGAVCGFYAGSCDPIDGRIRSADCAAGFSAATVNDATQGVCHRASESRAFAPQLQLHGDRSGGVLDLRLVSDRSMSRRRSRDAHRDG